MSIFITRPQPASAPLLLVPTPDPAPEPPRKRAKLWELNPSVHCSVIGTCLTTAELRATMTKALRREVAVTSDHDLHAQAVGLVGQPGDCAKLLHKTLDRRHETDIRRFSRLQGEAAVLEAWAEARRSGDIPGAYWAVLTHPDVGHAGMKRAFGDVHMLSHLVGAANRADIRRLTALEVESAALREKVERQQRRLHEAITSRDATIQRLSALSANAVSALPAASDDQAVAALRDVIAGFERRYAHEVSRRERAEKALEKARPWQARAEAATAERDALLRELLWLERHDGAGPSRPLPAERILYVGGRPGGMTQIRAALEDGGGTLLIHDGGLHDHPSLLAGLISQADRVVFPVDCVSHDAALTVKRVCRQLGKPWIPLRSSGLASFLAAVAVADQQIQEVAS